MSAVPSLIMPSYTIINYYIIIQVSIKSFPDYKYLLQENYVEYKYIFYLF
jgi:hypothetical protein